MSTNPEATAITTTSSLSKVAKAFASKTLVADVIPFNLHAIRRSRTVWEQQDTLPKSLTQYLYRRDTKEDKESDPYNQQLNADDLTSINNENNGIQYPGFCLTTSNFQLREPALGWKLGEGSWTAGQEDRRVGLTACYPRTHPNIVESPQAFIYIHHKSSMLVIGAVNDKAIYFLENGKWIYHDRHSPRVLLNENYVRVADDVYKIVVPSYDAVSYQVYRRSLDMLFKRADMAAIHPSLYSLPMKEPFGMIGPYLCHKIIHKTKFGYVDAGVNIDSGEPVAIDELGVLREILDSDRAHELEALFAFPGTETLLQAKEVRCKEGHILNMSDFYTQARTTRTFCKCQVVRVYAISKLAHKKLAAHDWRQENISTCVKVFSDSLKGLIVVHDKGHMLRNISGENIEIIRLKPIKVRVADYKKAIKADTSCEVGLGPTYLLPPEALSGHYTNSIDMYSLAMVFVSIAFPEAFETYVDYSQPQGPVFRAEMTKCLKEMAYWTANLRNLANAVIRMLSADSGERPTAKYVLGQIPIEISQMDYWEAKSLAGGEPIRKKAKTTNLNGSGSLKYQSTAGSVTSGQEQKASNDDLSRVPDSVDSSSRIQESEVESSAFAMSTTPTSVFKYGSEGGWSNVK